MDYDFKNIKFVDMSAYYRGCFAITEDGKLYSWGQNQRSDQMILQDKDTNEVYKPTLVKYFETRYKVLSVHAGRNLTVIHTYDNTFKKYRTFVGGKDNGADYAGIESFESDEPVAELKSVSGL